MSVTIPTLRGAMASLLLFAAMAVSAQSISGSVKDSNGEPVIGATVMEQGTQNGTVTDFDGNFTIKLQKAGNLNISYVGMKSQVVKTAGKETVAITLADDNTTLNDVVVVGYGTMKKSDLTGSVSSVSTEKLNAKGAPSVLENLQGSTPGVNITKSSSRTNGGMNVEIRGRSSINSSTTPLYVVDGVMCDNIDFLNSQDIERIDVLKDASSTAIYGSRATAGVIMVTTKGGLNVSKAQKPTISYDGYYGWTKVVRMPDFMDADHWYRYRLAKFTQADDLNSASPVYRFASTGNLGQALLQTSQSDTTSPMVLKQMLADGESYDWPSLMTQSGQSQNHYLAVSGATEQTTYHLGMGYNKNDGIYEGDSQETINFKGSLDARINKVVSAGFLFNLAHIDNSYANDNAIDMAYRVGPFMRPYAEDGSINHFPGNKGTMGTDGYQFSDFISPLDLMRNAKKERESWRAIGNVYVKFDLMKGLDFKTTFSPNYSAYDEGFFEGYKNPDTGKTYADKDTNSASLTQSRSFSYTWDNVLNYSHTFGKDHSVNLMALQSSEYGNTKKSLITSADVMENTDWYNLASGTIDATKTNNSYGEYSMLSWAARANYSYKGRYMFTGTIRWDGSSKFGEDKRWGCFPSAAVAWRISEEPWMAKTSEWLNNLKLRLSYGVTGNNKGVGNYAIYRTVSDPTYVFIDGVWQQGKKPNGIVDMDLHWEKSKEFNVGIDFAFLRSRINGTIDYYVKNSEDLLYSVQLPYEAGGVSLNTNIGKVRNTGLEISLNTVNIKNKDWEWNTTFTFATNKNRVKEINGVSDRIINGETGGYFLDYSANNIYGYEFQGIVSDRPMTVPDTELATSNGFTPGQSVRECDYYYKIYGVREGQPMIVDRDGNGKIDDNDKTIWNRDPAWTGSITSNLMYKNWDFSFNIYIKNRAMVNSSFLGSDYFDYHDRGRGKYAMDYYIPAGTIIDAEGVNADGTLINPVYQETTHYGTYPLAATNDNDGVGKLKSEYDAAKKYERVSFCKVKNITLGYTFPKQWISKIGCKYARLYFTVTNPFVFTHYKGFDPEWADANTKNDGPSTVTYQVGASVKF